MRSDLIYSLSIFSSSVSSLAFPFMVSTALNPSIICELRAEACCICSSLIFLYGCLNIKTSKMLIIVIKTIMANSVIFIRNRITPVTLAIPISIIKVKAILVKMSFIVKASENRVVISPVLLDAKNFIGSL